ILLHHLVLTYGIQFESDPFENVTRDIEAVVVHLRFILGRDEDQVDDERTEYADHHKRKTYDREFKELQCCNITHPLGSVHDGYHRHYCKRRDTLQIEEQQDGKHQYDGEPDDDDVIAE